MPLKLRIALQPYAARVLRHAGPAFVEDPLRVLRAARFMARFASLGFTIAPETMALMRELGLVEVGRTGIVGLMRGSEAS